MVQVNRFGAFVAGFVALAAAVKPAAANDFIQPTQETAQEKQVLVCMRDVAAKVGAKVETVGVRDFSNIRAPFSVADQEDRTPYILISDRGVYADAFVSSNGVEAAAGTKLNKDGVIDAPYRRVNSGFDGGNYKVYADFEQNGGQKDLASGTPAQDAVRSVASLMANCIPGAPKPAVR